MSWINRLATVACLVLATGYRLYAQGEFRDFRLPLAYYPEGSVRIELTARSARIRNDGTIHAQGVIIRFFSLAGEEETLITADDCVSESDGTRAHSQSAVMIQQGDMILSGVGFEWNGLTETLHIHSQARLIFNRKLLPSKTQD